MRFNKIPYKIAFLILICLLVSVNSNAQISKKAQKYFDEANYDIGLNQWNSAKEKLLLAVKASPKFTRAHLYLANVHFQLNDFPAAIQSYETTIEQGETLNKINLYIAKSYFEIPNLDRALSYLEIYLKSDKLSSKSRMEAERFRHNILFAQEAIKNPQLFNPINLGAEVNSTDDEYMPSLNADETTVLFTRKVNLQEDLYVTGLQDKNWLKAEVLAEDVISTGHNEGAHCISANGKLLLLTICNKKPTVGSCDIYFSKKTKDGWSEPKNIGKPINSTSWDSQPSLSADGKSLYFVSNRSGGYGGKDIWVSHYNGTSWGNPINLGPEINTELDEQTPFIHFDDETLYFSSDGHPGMGKQDIFISRKVNGKFTKPKNFGYPINTSSTESGMSISLDGLTAYYAALKDGGFGGMDIYQFETPEFAKPKRVTYVKASIYDENNKLTSANYTLTDINNNESIVFDFSDDGNILESLPSGKEYALHVEKEGYLLQSYHFQLKDTVVREAFVIEIKLSPISVGNLATLNNVFFETDSYILTKSSEPELNVLVDLLVNNPTLKLEIGGHTDNVGTDQYNLELSQKRAESVVNYLIEHGVLPHRLTAKGYGSSQPNFTNDTEEGRLKNRRTEFKVVE